jgi:hypothetical protein
MVLALRINLHKNTLLAFQPFWMRWIARRFLNENKIKALIKRKTGAGGKGYYTN